MSSKPLKKEFDVLEYMAYIKYVVKVYHTGGEMTTFGEFAKNLRIKNGITLRSFCRFANLDPSNWSKIERGINPPPKSRQILEEIADVLKLAMDSDDRQALLDLAVISHIPSELIDDRSVVDKLPVFFRTLRGEKPSREELEELIRMLEAV